MCHAAKLFQKWFVIIKQLLSLSEGDMTICYPLQVILPAFGEQIVISLSLKGNNCIMSCKTLARNSVQLFLWLMLNVGSKSDQK